MRDRIRRNRGDGNALPDTHAGDLRHAAARGGAALEPKTQAAMEARFGGDHRFADIRVHDDAAAARLAQAVDAPAFTFGQDVFFGTGYYAPESPAGRGLLAHELTHTLQQSEGAPNASEDLPIIERDAPVEREADAALAQMAEGEPVSVTTAAAPAIARGPWDLLDDIGDAIGGAVDTAGDFVSDVGSDVVNTVSDVGGDVIDTVADVGGDVVDTVSSAGSEALDVASGVGSVVGDMVMHPMDTAEGVYGVMKENAGYVKEGTEWLKGAIEEGEHAPGWTDWVADQTKGTMFEGAGGALDWAGDQYGSFAGGLTKGAVDLAGGLVGMAANPVDAAKGLFQLSEHIPGIGIGSKMLHAGYDLATGDTEGALGVMDPRNDAKFWGNLGGALIDPYVQAYNEKDGPDWAEMTGRAVFDVGSLLLGGEGAAEKGAATAATDVGKAAALTEDLGRAATITEDLGKTAVMTEDMGRAGAATADVAKGTEIAEGAGRIPETIPGLGEPPIGGGTVPPGGGVPGGRGAPDWMKNAGHGPAIPEDMLDDIMKGKNPPPPPGWEWKSGPPTGPGPKPDWMSKVGHGPAIPEDVLDDILKGKNPPPPPGWDWQVGPPTGGPGSVGPGPVSPTAPTMPGVNPYAKTESIPMSPPVSPTAPTMPGVNPYVHTEPMPIPVSPTAPTMPGANPFANTESIPVPGVSPKATTLSPLATTWVPGAPGPAPTLPMFPPYAPPTPTLPGLGPSLGGRGFVDTLLDFFS